jgi:hypothetical protein
MKSNQTNQLIPPTPPACPNWCELPVGHPYSDGGQYRTHMAADADHCFISQTEGNIDGEVTLCAPVFLDGVGPTTSAAVRQVAADMARAAHLWDQIQGVQTVDAPKPYVGNAVTQDAANEDDIDVIPRRFVELAIGMKEIRLGPDQARKLGLKLLTEADTIEDLTAQVYV